MIKHFQRNSVGRDFVVGDIHGCFGLLEIELGKIGFSPSGGDRLFSVGDLIDRGPRSIEAPEWLARIPIHAVRGNHEDMVIGVFQNSWDSGNYRANGGSWFFALTKQEQQLFVEALLALPIAIEVDTQAGMVGIVHANCPTNNWGDMHAGMRGENGESFIMRCMNGESFIMRCMWDRSRYQSGRAEQISGVHQVVVGHTPIQKETMRGNVRYIDTGAVYGNKLTIIQL